MWRQASLPAVEGGILPPGKNTGRVKRPNGPVVFFAATWFRRAGSPGSTSAKMADATIFRPALRSPVSGLRPPTSDLCRLVVSCQLSVVRPATSDLRPPTSDLDFSFQLSKFQLLTG